ncbi:MAG: hypothetical protein MUP70_06825, partial [Candidatus Aminicenantes bacterium]|nr:hypothetical protein [Candidatus Aminicenantes bacterium]
GFLFILTPFFIFGQLTGLDLEESAKWEDFLRTAEIVDQMQFQSREAVTSPWKLTLEKDGVRKYALWKNPLGHLRGFDESWKWEIASYRLDRLLGLHMVPVTVERDFQGKPGSCQIWVDDTISMEERREKKMRPPSDKVVRFTRAAYLQHAFDNLICNVDRRAGNVLVTEDWRCILIDHSRTFRTQKEYTTNLMFIDRNPEDLNLMKELPETFVQKLRDLNEHMVIEAVGPYLTKKEVRAMLKRRDLIVQVIDTRIQKYGKAAVLY